MTKRSIMNKNSTAIEKDECCNFGKVCNDLPSICIVLQIIAVLGLVGVLGYLFVAQELLS